MLSECICFHGVAFPFRMPREERNQLMQHSTSSDNDSLFVLHSDKVTYYILE